MKRLFVGNIPFSATEQRIREWFGDGQDCKVEKVNIVLGEDGRSRGFAFVDLSSEEEARLAIKDLDGADMDGRYVNVNEAKEKPRRNNDENYKSWSENKKSGRDQSPRPSNNNSQNGRRSRRDRDSDEE